MKWCFLVNNVDYVMEFTGRLCKEAMDRGDECLVVFNSKVTEFSKKKYFPSGVRQISKVDWLAEHYDASKKDFGGVWWKDFFPTFERKAKFLDLTYENSVEIISQLCQFFDFLFTLERPDIIVNESPANVFTNIAYRFCQTYHKNYVGFIDSRIFNRIDIFDKEYTCSLYEKTFKELNERALSEKEKNFSAQFIQDFLSHKQLPSNIVYQLDLAHSWPLARYIKREGKNVFFWMRYLSWPQALKKNDYETQALFHYAIRYPFAALWSKAKKIIFKDTFSHLDQSDDFFLFPLHFYPEASIMVWATYFSDQLSVIKNVAFSLPFPYKLYVKEHPMAQGTRAMDFYRQLKKIPNVVLISPGENNEQLIKKSKGVITITSTLGLEAAFMGKPVYVLGNVFYQYHPCCIKIKNFEDLAEKITTKLGRGEAVKNLQESNARFVISYYQNNIPGDLYCDYQYRDTNDYKAVYKSVKNKFLTNS